ncbi:hypothetical protein [Streptomyces sp. NPDC093094]|uniref:hypothetical protein n=1 Tax=Streptomyces sp. NPDC093094 TaxID=3366026 RepID=UPI00381C3177
MGGAGLRRIFTEPVSSAVSIAPRALGAEVFDGVGADIVADGAGVPACAAQQPLHRARPRMPGLFGRLPAVLPLGT